MSETAEVARSGNRGSHVEEHLHASPGDNDLLVLKRRCIRQALVYVGLFEVGVVGQNFTRSHSPGQKFQHDSDRDSQTSNTRPPAHHVLVERDPIERHQALRSENENPLPI